MDKQIRADRTSVSGVVLAGGMSRRVGRNKALETIGGQLLIHRVLDRLSELTEDLVVVVNSPERATMLDLPPQVKVVTDRYPGKGSLGGLFSGLCGTPPLPDMWALTVACDMPFLNMGFLAHMLTLRPGHDAVVPVVENRPEPLHALYSRSCLPFMEQSLEADDLKITRFFDKIRVCYVPEDEIKCFDPEMLSFFNVNTQVDLERALELTEKGE
jgi:molybdopterin-guanine dinucleotide biosynthesis protein A